MYTLKAPTGIGKTFTILELSERLNQINGGKYKIIYGLPLTSIIDQNYDVLENILEFNLKEEYEKYPSKYLIKDHYLSDLKIEENQETKNFSDVLNSELLLKSWCSSHIVTTFVQIFHSVLGNTNNLLRKFHNMSNSIIIMDEIQSIPPKYHKIWGKIIKVLAKNFKIYFIFLTATQPEILSEEDYIDLSNENVNRDEEFNRVVVKTIKNLMPITIDVFLDEFKNVFKGSNVLLVMNTKDSALTAYKELKKMYLDYEVISLTGFKASIDRSKTIEYIKRKLRKKEKIIVVATQLVEAGVNLDFDLGFRDLTTFDSLVQFCGRINRNNDLKPQKGEVYVFNLQTNYGQAYAEQVYRESIPLLNITKNILTTRKDIYSKDFMDLSKEYFRLVKENYQYESDRILDAIKILNFGNYAHRKEIAIDKIKLIENNDTRRIIICKTKEINEKVLRLKECLKKSSEIFEFEEKKDLYIEIKKISKELSQYEVVVRKKHIKPYKDILKTIKEDDLYFADYENFEKIYSKDIGFKKKEGRK
ncbi:MAG: CRISPR-associated helicase Cas3' [Candidatus Woesearchaeota archaeon]